MRNIKRMFSFVLVFTVLFISSAVGYAASYNWDDGINYVMEVKANDTTVSIGEDVVIGIYLYDSVNGGSVDITNAPSEGVGFTLSYDKNSFTFKDKTGVEATDDFNHNENAGTILFASMEKAISFTKADAFVTLTFTAKENVASADFALLEGGGECFLNETVFATEPDLFEYKDGTLATPATVTVAAAGGEEEFTVENALATGDKMMTKDSTTGKLVEVDAVATDASVIAVFAKAVESKLEAETYGIVFGGVKYPGKLAVEAGNSWAVKLIIPNGMLRAGSYDYGTYVGDAAPVLAASPFVVAE